MLNTREKKRKVKSLKPDTFFLEINNLISSILAMKKNISKQNAKLINHQKNLENIINKKTEELVYALNLANESARAKSQFLSTMSHELRTPINAILGFSYLIDKSNLTDEQKDQLDNIFHSSELLLHIINDILDYSKLEAGKVLIENIPFSLNSIMKSIFDMTKHLAINKGLSMEYNFDENIPKQLIGDPNKLRQVLLNLIGNAVKFTQEGKISISSSLQKINNNKAFIKISVKDTGIGISKEHAEKLFSPFYQADASINRKFGGSGLGLCISHQIITQMQGDISVNSVENQGSEFIIQIALAISENQVISEKSQENKTEQNYSTKKVLAVDDNPINLKVLASLIKKLNIQVDTALSGIEAIEKTKKEAYDIIFMDIQMPELNGIETTKHIRELILKQGEYMPKTNVIDVPIIAVTANALKSDKEECLQAGMNGHLAKPIIPTELYNVIYHYFNK